MAKCDICQKKPQFGNAVSFAQKKTRRQFKPNLQTTTIYEGGLLRKVKICTRCLRTLNKV